MGQKKGVTENKNKIAHNREKIAHHAVITVFVKQEEEELREKIKEKLTRLIPFDLEEENVKVEEETALGFDERKIEIYKITLVKNRHTKRFFWDLISRFSREQLDMLNSQLGSRIDDNMHFFIRLDKKRWLEDEIFITDKGDCFHIKITLAVFPAKKDNAIHFLEKLLNKEI